MLRQDELVRAMDEMMTDDQIETIADSLHSHSLDNGCSNIDPDTDEPQGLEFRLRMSLDGVLHSHVGSADFDTDHRGFIVSGWIPWESDFESVKETVSEALQELFDEISYPEFG
jgi:hypothetical protein